MSPKNGPPEVSGDITEIIVTGRRPLPPNPFPFGRPSTADRDLSSGLREQTQTAPHEEGSGPSQEAPLTPARIAILSGLNVKTGERGADISSLRNEIIRTFPEILATWEPLGLEFPPTITSGQDGRHGQNSLHYEGLAIDLRVNDIPIEKATQFKNGLREALGPNYDVTFEKEGTLEFHIHLEYDPD